MAPLRPIPVTIITGFLGSGKTTLILNLIPQLPKSYKLALLKNEFGDVAVDSQLASSSAISGVQELLNGCICCNLVGQLSDTLETLSRDVTPDRIIIETSGSAFPATLAMEVNRIAEKTGGYVLDGVMSVIDVENWKGYEDTSLTAKLQARYTDLIVLNKWELVDERKLEDCEDRILDLEVDPPTPRSKSDKGWVNKDIVFGLDAKLAKLVDSEHEHHHDHDHQSEVEVLSVTLSSPAERLGIDLARFEKLLEEASKDEIYRIKGILYASSAPRSSMENKPKEFAAGLAVGAPSRYILNWAFGRWSFTPAPFDSANPTLRMTVITARYESSKWQKRLEAGEFTTLEHGSVGSLSVKRVT
ncbi:cobW-domain-containing protein [Mytilinidion resinicola]|uniref:CobW-domain-containing protein n=1 Tax=Mytilinidion resinicola TaxID=574789 RepID=A0A6A6YQ77_9PEZI|nr:cobW-domain-containing protein [Mytilinidion resinicola]KAF2810047.1 cobW-domain-containing protein [Mytilinidion resinicola]